MSKEKIVALALGFLIFILIAGSAGISMKGKKAQQLDNAKKISALENSDGNDIPVLNYVFEFTSDKVPQNLSESLATCLPNYEEKEDFALELLIQWFDDRYPDAKREQYQTSDGIQLTKILLDGTSYVIFDNYEGVPSSFEYHANDKVLRCRQLDDFECYCDK